MNLHRICVLAVFWAAGCATTDPQAYPTSTVEDPRGNLNGDPTRTYMDIVEASVTRDGTSYYVFSVTTASRFPDPAEMTGGKRVDFIWMVDSDKSRATGQSDAGNDYNLHLYLDETGWHPTVYAVSDEARKHGEPPPPEKCPIKVERSRASLWIPQSSLPTPTFGWWAWSMTQNAPAWPPVTENSATRKADF